VKNTTRTSAIILALALALTLGLGVRAGLRLWERPVLAQAAGVASTPEAQSPAKDEQEKDEGEAYRKSPKVVVIGKALGMNPEQSAIAFEVFNFGLLAIGSGWVLMKTGIPMFDIDPLPKMIRNRDTAIQKDLVDARTATEEARIRLSGVEARLAKLDDEIAAMRTHAEQDTTKEEQRLKSALAEETKKILASAEQEIAAATLHARKLLQQQAAELAIEQAARKLTVSAETDRLLIQRFAQRLTSGKGEN
jgi:F-type H+-transporting ATPase subunit b